MEQTKHDADNHRVSLEQQIYKIKQQQIELNDLYERELKNLNDMHQLITNICENNYLVISNYERYAQQLQSIKQDQENNSFIQSFILQIDQILQQQNHIDGTANTLSISDNETTTDSDSKYKIISILKKYS
jgi:7-keto-8-aminopelargonate synthetase-like enzyme